MTKKQEIKWLEGSVKEYKQNIKWCKQAILDNERHMKKDIKELNKLKKELK